MKVFHLSDHLPNYHQVWGGAEQVAYRYLKLLTLSQKVEIIAGTVRPIRPIKENFKNYRIWVIEDLFPKKWLLYITGIKNRLVSFDLLSFLHLLLLFKKERPQIVHFHKTNQISLCAILAAKISGAKVVLSMYDYWYFCPGAMLIDKEGRLCQKFHGRWCGSCSGVYESRFLLPVTSLFRKQVFDFFYRFVDAFPVLSQSQGEILERYGLPKDKIFLIRQVFDFEKRKAGKIKRGTILFAGWIDQRKGLQILIEAMPAILKLNPQARLTILEIGQVRSFKEKILKRIKNLALDTKIEFHGRIPKEEVEKFLEMTEVVVVPEQWENMSPVIIIEAMAMGKAIVASKIGGIPEFIKDNVNGLLAERGNAKDFAEKIAWVLENPQAAEKLGKQAAKDIVKICSQEKILANLLKLYNRLCQ
jgi:glycosyltransferase involved in cell wall biosynthesis